MPSSTLSRGRRNPALLVHGGLLALLTFAALMMRLAQGGESLWVDELHTAWVVGDDLPDIAPRAKAGNQAPLYFYLVRAATWIGGLNEGALRAPSLLAGLALVPLAFAVVLRWTGSAAAAWAAALLAALDRDFLFYATEARVYALLQLLALARLAVLVQLLSSPKILWRAGYVGLAAAMFYLHYTTALLWLGEAACLAAAPKQRSSYALRWRRFFVDSTVIALLCLPAAPHLSAILERRENWEQFVPPPTAAQLRADPSARSRLLQRVTPWTAYLAPPLAVLAVAGLSRSRTVKTFVMRRLPPGGAAAESPSAPPAPASPAPLLAGPEKVGWLLALILWMLAPVVAAWTASVADAARLFLYRYLIGSATVVPVLAGVLCGLAPTTRWRRAAAAFAVLAALAAVGPGYYLQYAEDGRLIAARNEDWRTAVARLNHSGDRLPVLVYAGLIECDRSATLSVPALREFCLLPVSGIYRIDRRRAAAPWTGGGQAPPIETCRALHDQDGAWFLVRLPPRRAAAMVDAAARRLAACGVRARIAQTENFGDVTLARLEF